MPTPKPITTGRKKRTTAVRKLVLIELSTVTIMRKLGAGKLGRGIDRAAQILSKKGVK